ncbi:hypothetical protein MHUMG1_05748 [Metarhizium humberi]|uniref:NmrA-like domain-containing protein n=1 Tax=Metarhizium humberi TaxID=2596975 RepID=A0A9P8MA93_9HYPO|nr:hypothetical protein MHUMG1_05748 [Metarhizium humberi]
MSAKIITVVGATGNQGEVVINRLLQSPALKELNIRALTRDSNSDKSKALRAKGAGRLEAVTADLNDKASLDVALAGSDYVFANLNSYLNMEGEVQQGKNVIDAAKQNNVSLFIWSTLPSVQKISMGRYVNVRHAENKSKILDYLAQSGLTWVGASTSFFADNLLWPRSVSIDDGSYVVSSGSLETTVRLPMTWLERDLGPFVTAVVEAHVKGDPSAPRDENIVVAGFRTSLDEVAAELARQTGKPARAITGTGAMSIELQEMFSCFNEFGNYEDKNVPSEYVEKNGIQHSTLQAFVRCALVPALESRGQ